MKPQRLGKFERMALEQEYKTALSILHVLREHLENNDIAAIRQFVLSWDKVYQDWLTELKDRP
jgi:hypothetical protein